MAVGEAHAFPGFLTPVLAQLFKATDYFSHMLLQMCEAKICRKESSPQPGIELTTTRSWVWHAHHWASRAGHQNFNSQGQTILVRDASICFLTPVWTQIFLPKLHASEVRGKKLEKEILLQLSIKATFSRSQVRNTTNWAIWPDLQYFGLFHEIMKT